jgi:hypothetical protein
MEDGTRGRRGESALSRCEDRCVCRTRPTSSSEHKGEAKTQRSQPRRCAKRNRSPDAALATPVAIQIGLDSGTQLVAE